MESNRIQLPAAHNNSVVAAPFGRPITNGGSPDELDNHNFCPQEWVPKYSRPWDN